MSTYVIGDIQGCWLSFRRLLTEVDFDETRDHLWCVGDLVNRGPASLEVLRFLMRLDARATCVLGNHDLHLIARAEGLTAPKPRDTLEAVLAADDLTAIIDWLVKRPLLYRQGEHLMVHAGLNPNWSIAEAEAAARACESELRETPTRRAMLLARPTSLRTFTSIRTCHADGSLCDYSGAPTYAPDGCEPWFHRRAEVKHQAEDVTIIFGHWSALGLNRGQGYLCLDSGCVWGRSLTAVRLEDFQIFQVPAQEAS